MFSDSHRKLYLVPGPLVFSLLACCIVGIALCVKWVLTDELGGFNSENGNWHFLLMTLFIIFTAIGTLSFRLFTRISRPMAKVSQNSSVISQILKGLFSLFMRYRYQVLLLFLLWDLFQFSTFIMTREFQIYTPFTRGLGFYLSLYLVYR